MPHCPNLWCFWFLFVLGKLLFMVAIVVIFPSLRGNSIISVFFARSAYTTEAFICTTNLNWDILFAETNFIWSGLDTVSFWCLSFISGVGTLRWEGSYLVLGRWGPHLAHEPGTGKLCFCGFDCIVEVLVLCLCIITAFGNSPKNGRVFVPEISLTVCSVRVALILALKLWSGRWHSERVWLA